MGAVVLLAFTAAFNPTEIAATTVMLLLPSPERLMLGYWLGAMITGVASGLVIVFALKDTGAEHTTRHTVSPIVQLVFAALLVVAAVALAKGGGKRVRERHDKRHEKEEGQETAEVAADAARGQPVAHVRGRDPAVVSRRLLPRRSRPTHPPALRDVR